MNNQETKRKIFHIISGVVFVALIYFNLLTPLILFIIIIIGIILSLVSKKAKIPVIHSFLQQLDRPEDIKIFPGKGALFYAIGVFLVLWLFPKDIAMASITILALGDAVAPLVGQYGHIKNPFTNKKKFLEGTVAGAVTGAVAALFFVTPLEAILASVIAMVAEGVDLKIGIRQVDDNIIMPLAAGTVIWLLRVVI